MVMLVVAAMLLIISMYKINPVRRISFKRKEKKMKTIDRILGRSLESENLNFGSSTWKKSILSGSMPSGSMLCTSAEEGFA